MLKTCRRGKLECGDMDVLLTHPSYTSTDGSKERSQLLKQVVNLLESKNLIIDTISLGDVKFMVSIIAVKQMIIFIA
jgi:DNA polymerase beta